MSKMGYVSCGGTVSELDGICVLWDTVGELDGICVLWGHCG